MIAAGGQRDGQAHAPDAVAGRDVEDLPVDRDRLRMMIAQDRRGEAILSALVLLDAGVEIEPGDLAVAIDTLVRTGRTSDARAIALQTILFMP